MLWIRFCALTLNKFESDQSKMSLRSEGAGIFDARKRKYKSEGTGSSSRSSRVLQLILNWYPRESEGKEREGGYNGIQFFRAIVLRT